MTLADEGICAGAVLNVSHVGYEWSTETTGEYRMEKERKVIDWKVYEGAAECAVATVLPAVSHQESKVTIKFKVIDINYDEGIPQRWIEKRHMRLDLTIGLKPSGSGTYPSLAGRGTITDSSLNIGDTFQVWVEVTKEKAKFGIIFEDRTELRDDFKNEHDQELCMAFAGKLEILSDKHEVPEERKLNASSEDKSKLQIVKEDEAPGCDCTTNGCPCTVL